MKGTITVTNQKSNGNLVIGGFYTPTIQVANNLGNDGRSHPGWLGYYRTEFPSNGFTILSEYNFHYASCNYSPGGFWPDQKTGDHTLIIYSTTQSLSEALSKLEKLVWNNVYIYKPIGLEVQRRQLINMRFNISLRCRSAKASDSNT